MNKEQRQRHVQNILEGEGKSPVKDKSQEREKRQWMNQWKRQCYGRTQTLDLENGTILFLFSTSLSHIGSEIEKRKIARAQSKKKKSPLDKKKKKKKKKSSQKCLPSLKPFTALDLVSFNFYIFFVAHRSSLWLAKLTWISTCYLCIRSLMENPVEKHSKALRKARLHHHVST